MYLNDGAIGSFHEKKNAQRRLTLNRKLIGVRPEGN